MEYRFYQGDGLVLISYSSSATAIYLRWRAEYDSAPGKAVHGFVNHTPNSDRTLASSSAPGIFSEPGKLTQLVVAPVSGTSGLKRGQCFAEVYITDGQGAIRQRVGANYIADGNGGISLGRFVDPGPGGGEGFLSWVEVFHNRAGNEAQVEFALGATNAIRRIHGMTWFYHYSGDVASRTLQQPFIANPSRVKPTGFTTTGANAQVPIFTNNLTLTANEEGMYYALTGSGDGLMVEVDNGTATVLSSATKPSPFPYTCSEDELGVIRFRTITLGEAADTHSAYVLVEEWLVI